MIELIGIHKQFSDLIVLHNMNMILKEASITSILGPSGCGKSTLLSITAGLIKPTKGQVLGMEQKLAGFLFQEPRLLPWKNTLDNLAFVLPDEMSKKEKKVLCQDMVEAVGLTGYENHYPHELSGGMRQRLAMARAFIIRSDVLFMDEPFQSLDLKRREQMIQLLKSLWLKHKPAVLMVTHDVQEALLLSDRIYILSDKPTQIIQEIANPMSFEQRTIQNEAFYQLEQEIINRYILNDSFDSICEA